MPSGPAFQLAKFNLQEWIRKNQKHLKPPVSNKQFFAESDDVIIFVSGGPNARNAFHVNPTEELFYQLKGDVAVRVRRKAACRKSNNRDSHAGSIRVSPRFIGLWQSNLLH